MKLSYTSTHFRCINRTKRHLSIPDPNADCMVPAGTVVALDPPVPHVAAHWFVLMWWWVFHIVHQQVFEHCHYLWTTNTTPRPGNMMEKVGIKSKLMQIVNSVAFKSAVIMLQFLHVTDLFHVSQNGSCLLFS